MLASPDLSPKSEDSQTVRRGWIKSMSLVGALSFEIVIPIGLGLFLGSRLDQKMNWFPIGTCGGFLLGTLVAVFRIRKLVSQKWK